MPKLRTLPVKGAYRNFYFLLGLLFLLACFIALPVQAHHPWEGQEKNLNLLQGFVSGLAHPVLGFDHFLFLMSIGLIGGMAPIKRIPPLVSVGLLGAISSQFFPLFPAAELIISLSLVASALVALGKLPIRLIFPMIYLHGYVLGNAMIGVEMSPLSGYLLGLLISESLAIWLGILTLKRLLIHKDIFCGVVLGAGLIMAGNTGF
ncbi:MULTISPECIES: HupE/UreJ family protein [Prochlorococcus]|uniref:HupE/UreJ family protein n=1 Tax=Prochlorococcus TaxID=1218 RepID=UPI000533A159|nr:MULTISPECIES: HupE/UreJ family protein [Prochlorococcus]KGG12806.1 HupE-UreJ family cobalt transporter [Prochlorococcus sp. MIT 0601]